MVGVPRPDVVPAERLEVLARSHQVFLTLVPRHTRALGALAGAGDSGHDAVAVGLPLTPEISARLQGRVLRGKCLDAVEIGLGDAHGEACIHLGVPPLLRHGRVVYCRESWVGDGGRCGSAYFGYVILAGVPRGGAELSLPRWPRLTAWLGVWSGLDLAGGSRRRPSSSSPFTAGRLVDHFGGEAHRVDGDASSSGLAVHGRACPVVRRRCFVTTGPRLVRDA
mmetsp:Transcript_6154/g.15192  ORF Transcript_6154/g.15192 Transcript_6154/m.15192 type:complete len:223 (+) Transcript_6154:2368-3036(+)